MVNLIDRSLGLFFVIIAHSVTLFGAETASIGAGQVSIQDVTGNFRKSQELLAEAYKIKGIERALRTLNKAELAVKKAKDFLKLRTAENSVESRMKSRLAYKLDQDQNFLNRLRADLGMAEQDPFEMYIILRRSLIKDPQQRSNVVRMDHQILLTLEARTHNPY